MDTQRRQLVGRLPLHVRQAVLQTAHDGLDWPLQLPVRKNPSAQLVRQLVHSRSSVVVPAREMNWEPLTQVVIVLHEVAPA